MMKFGWVADREPLSNTIKYNRARRDSSHQFSATAVGEMFGFREYGEILPLKDFLTLPCNVLEDIIDSVAVGKRKAKEVADRMTKKNKAIPEAEQLLKQLELQNITNVLVVNYDARLFMEFIESNKVGKIFVHFPVPWDKKPHRRIYSNEFVNEALRVLKVTGTLELRTDSRKYFDFCTEVLTNLPKGRITIDINKDLAISSKYEDRWKKQGKNIYDVILEAFDEDKNINLNFDFSFDFKIDFDNTLKTIPTKSIIEKNYFIHIEELYTIENTENSGLIKLTMGNFDRPVTKYLYVNEGNVSYYQGNPLPTSSNINAHEKLKEILSK